MNVLKHCVMWTCRLLLIATLLVWLWLLWLAKDPLVLLLPAGFLYAGLSYLYLRGLPPGWERWHERRKSQRVVVCVLALVTAIFLLRAQPWFDVLLIPGPSTPSASVQITLTVVEGIQQGFLWILGGILMLMAFFRLPGLERRMYLWLLRLAEDDDATKGA